jgi:hypothetical protein
MSSYYIFNSKPLEKGQVGTRVWWEDNIKLDLTETGWEGMDWIKVAQDKFQWRGLLNTVINTGFLIDGKFLHQLNNHQCFKEDSIPRIELLGLTLFSFDT